MKIEYIWISKYKKLENFETNFGGEFNFILKKNYKLLIEKNNLYDADFFNEKDKHFRNINSSIIVGKNGVGKTTLLEFIVEILNEEEYRNVMFKEGRVDYIVIYSIDGKYYIEANLNEDVVFEFYNTKEFKIKYKYIESNDYKIIFFSNVFDIKSMDVTNSNKSVFHYDISNNYELGRINNVNQYIRNRLKDQLYFISKNEDFIIKNSLFAYPENLTLEVNHENFEKLERIFQKAWIPLNNVSGEIFYLNKVDEVIDLLLSNLVKSFLNALINMVTRHAVDSLYFQNNEFTVELINEIYFYSEKMDDFFKDMTGNLYKRLKFENAYPIEEKDIIISKIKSFRKEYKKYYESIISLSKLSYTIFDERNNNIELKDEIFDVDFYQSQARYKINFPLKNKDVSNFIEIYLENDFSIEIASIYINKLSSGEYAIISFFSTFTSLFERALTSEDKSDYIIIVDEGDLYLHPQWQKEWFFYFLNFLKEYLKNNIQLVLTTHSPLVLSDFPKSNVIFLNNTSQEVFNMETFGANISELLANSFFIEGGLIGKLAKEKINNFTDELIKSDFEEFQKKKNNYRKFIDSIGEVLVRRQLNKIYYNKLLNMENNLDEKEEIKFLEERLAKLKREIL